MLDAGSDGGSAGVLSGRYGDGQAFGCGGVGKPCVLKGIGAEVGFPCAGDDQEISGLRGRDGLRKHRDCNGGCDAWVVDGLADDDVGRHGVAEQSDAAIDVWEGEGCIGDAGELLLEKLGGAFDARDVAGHGLGVSAMTFEVIGDGDVAGLGQRQSVGFHQLAGAGKAVGDDDGGGFGTAGALVDGCGRGACGELGDGEARTGAFQVPEADGA